jgi:hypothetical protein
MADTFVWQKKLADGSEARVERAYEKNLVFDREYLVIVVKPNGHKVGACLVDVNGHVKQWYGPNALAPTYDRKEIVKALKELPEALVVEQIHET